MCRGYSRFVDSSSYSVFLWPSGLLVYNSRMVIKHDGHCEYPLRYYDTMKYPWKDPFLFLFLSFVLEK
jgi:hypothetical protein